MSTRSTARKGRSRKRAATGQIAFMEWWWRTTYPSDRSRQAAFPRWYIIADDRGLRELEKQVHRLRSAMKEASRRRRSTFGGREVGLAPSMQRRLRHAICGNNVDLVIVGYNPSERASVHSKFGRARLDDSAAQIWKKVLAQVRRDDAAARKAEIAWGASARLRSKR